jgi:threonine dehydrogenase-like Zn-dependent dehydrogenase
MSRSTSARSLAPAGNAGGVVDVLEGQAECAEFIADRKVDVERLFTHCWQLEQAEDAYRLFDTQTTGKAVILPS